MNIIQTLELSEGDDTVGMSFPSWIGSCSGLIIDCWISERVISGNYVNMQKPRFLRVQDVHQQESIPTIKKKRWKLILGTYEHIICL